MSDVSYAVWCSLDGDLWYLYTQYYHKESIAVELAREFALESPEVSWTVRHRDNAVAVFEVLASHNG